MSSNLEAEIAQIRMRLDAGMNRLGGAVIWEFRKACEHTARDVVVNGDPARTQVLHKNGRLVELKRAVVAIAADMERVAVDALRNPDFWPHRGNGNIELFESSVPGASEMDPQPPKRFVDALGTPAVQHLKKLFEFYGYAFPRTLLLWPQFPTDELSAYIKDVRKLRDLQQALAAQEPGTPSAEELWLKA
jgi:hypothetical protein